VRQKSSSNEFSSHIHTNNLMGHLQALTNGAQSVGNRAVGVGNGYSTSVQYVVDTLRSNTGYIVTLQNITYPGALASMPPTMSVVNPVVADWKYGADFTGVSGTVDISASVHYILGCSLSDYADGWLEGEIALVDSGISCLL